jgi:hypothetical protein
MTGGYLVFMAPKNKYRLNLVLKILIRCRLYERIAGYTTTGGFIMRNVFTLIFALLFLVSIARPQDKVIYPLELTNGDTWNSKTAAEKLEYLTGFYEGLAIISKDGDGQCLNVQEKSKARYQGLLTYESITTGVDTFFKRRAYQSLPVIVALEYVAKKAQGASPKELDEFVTYKKRVFSSNVSPN